MKIRTILLTAFVVSGCGPAFTLDPSATAPDAGGAAQVVAASGPPPSSSASSDVAIALEGASSPSSTADAGQPADLPPVGDADTIPEAAVPPQPVDAAPMPDDSAPPPVDDASGAGRASVHDGKQQKMGGG